MFIQVSQMNIEQRSKILADAAALYGAGTLTARGAGDVSAVADNATVEGRAQNRRMEVIPQAMSK